MFLYLYGLKLLKFLNKMFWVFVGNKKDLMDLKMFIVNYLGFFLFDKFFFYIVLRCRWLIYF